MRKKKRVRWLILTILIILSLLPFFRLTGFAFQEVSVPCIDNDKQDFYTAGNTVQKVVSKDYCLSDKTLVEFYCDSGVQRKIINCDSCRGGRCIKDVLKVGIIEDFFSKPIKSEISLMKNLSRDKQLDLIVLHENFLGAYTLPGKNYYLNLIGENGRYYVIGANNDNLLRNFMSIRDVAIRYQVNILLVVQTNYNNQKEISALLIDTKGEINYKYGKNSRFDKFFIETREGKKYSAFMGICSPENQENGILSLYENSTSSGMNADLFIHPGWGEAPEMLPLAVMEVSQTGNLSEETYNFIKNSDEHRIFLQVGRYGLENSTREEILSKIIKKEFPFDFLDNMKKAFLTNNDLKETGYIIDSDQLVTSGILSLDGKKFNYEVAEDYSYIYGELEF